LGPLVEAIVPVSSLLPARNCNEAIPATFFPQIAESRRNFRRSRSETLNVGEMRFLLGGPIVTPKCALLANS